MFRIDHASGDWTLKDLEITSEDGPGSSDNTSVNFDSSTADVEIRNSFIELRNSGDKGIRFDRADASGTVAIVNTNVEGNEGNFQEGISVTRVRTVSLRNVRAENNLSQNIAITDVGSLQADSVTIRNGPALAIGPADEAAIDGLRISQYKNDALSIFETDNVSLRNFRIQNNAGFGKAISVVGSELNDHFF